MKVLSLFDGISVAQQALKELGYDVEYYASEIDKYAIQLTQKNHPNTKQLGSVVDIKKEMVGEIDLLIGGSPCQDLSIAGKRAGLSGARSGLFYEYVRIRDEVKPKFFILENVNSMPKDAKDTISKELGVQPVMINASLVSAQNRKRLFWVGKLQEDGTYKQVEISQPEDRVIKISDIMEFEVDDKYFETTKNTVRKNDKNWQWDVSGKGYNSQQDRATHISQKSKTLPSSRTEDKCKIFYGTTCRKLTPTECERLQSLPDGYTEGVSNSQRYKGLGNAFNCEVIKHIIKQLK